jgi:wyosine [tRNA(Phe)-imidazoG37] synthetase (radical SAM superfamily)
MLPYPITGISSRRAGEEIESIWNGSEIKEIRRSVLDGDFSYCSRMNCSFITSGSLPKKADVTDPILRDIIDNKRTDISSDPRLIVLSHDLACNLSCPSCRTEIIATRQAARDEMDRFVDRFILPLMEDNPSVVLSVAGNGDPFGSKHYRRLLQNLDPARHAGVALALQCNGLLLTPREWESLSHLHHLIGSLGVSIDAAEPATYENLRRPGKWSVIVENMEFLSKLRREGKIGYLWIRFVVQNENFEQMPAFVELGQRWSVDKVWFEKLSNFGTFNADDFEKHSVTDSSHPNHSRFLEVLRNPILRSKEVDLFNVASYLDYFSDAEVMTTP